MVAKSASVSLQFSSHTPTSFFKHDGGCVNARFLPRDKSDRYGGYKYGKHSHYGHYGRYPAPKYDIEPIPEESEEAAQDITVNPDIADEDVIEETTEQ